MDEPRRPGGLTKFRSTDREECGVIVRNSENHFYILKIKNRAADPEDYEIWVSDVQQVEKFLSDDEVVVGFFHTHLPQHVCAPSKHDIEGTNIFPHALNLIYKPSTKEICWYGADEVITAT